MVDHRGYRGCATCTARKVRCDETHLECLRCRKAKKPCLGHPDGGPVNAASSDDNALSGDLRVGSYQGPLGPDGPVSTPTRSRSDSCQDGAPSQRLQKLQAPIPATPAFSFNGGHEVVVRNTERGDLDAIAYRVIDLAPELNYPVDQRAIAYLFTKIVSTPPISELYGGCLTSLPTLYKTIEPTSALSTAIAALALAIQSKTVNQNYISPQAMQNYVKALSSTRESLQHPDETKRNETLMTILVLSLYEILTCSKHSITAWAAHIRGAGGLVKLRGRDQLSDELGQKLFYAFQNQLILACISHGDHLPLSPSDFQEFKCPAPPRNPGTLFSGSLLYDQSTSLLALNSELQELENHPDDEYFIEKVLQMREAVHLADHKISLWFGTREKFAHCKSVQIPSNMPEDHALAEDVYTSTTLVYLSLWSASVWNGYRALRIFANNILLHCHQLLDTANYQQPSFTSRQRSMTKRLADEICMSTPFFLGYRTINEPNRTQYPGKLARQEREASVLCGYYTMWPLFVAGCVDALRPPQREWIQGRLRFIADELGIKQAHALERLLAEKAMNLSRLREGYLLE